MPLLSSLKLYGNAVGISERKEFDSPKKLLWGCLTTLSSSKLSAALCAEKQFSTEDTILRTTSVGHEYTGDSNHFGESHVGAPGVDKNMTGNATQPISYENFGREWQNISGQDSFDGFRLEAAKQVNKYLQACHTFYLGTQMRDVGCLYQFGPTVAITSSNERSQGVNGQQMPSFFAMAKLASDGTVQGRIIKQFCPNFDVKLNFNSSLKDEQRNMYEISLDNTGKDWASSLKLAWQSCWIVNGMFSQVLTPRLQLGGEVTYVGANGASMSSVGARYTISDNSVVNCQLSRQPDFKSPTGLTNDTNACKLQYVRKVTERFSVGSEVEYTHPSLDSALRIGWEYLFRQARVQGQVDTTGKISVFAQDYNGFGISGVIDYWRGDYKFGFMMHVLPPPETQQ